MTRRIPGTYNQMANRLRGEAFAFRPRLSAAPVRRGGRGRRKGASLGQRRGKIGRYTDDLPRAGFSGGPVGSEHCSIDSVGPPTGMGCGSGGGCGGGSVGGCGCVGASGGGHDHDHDHDHGAGSEPCCDGCATGKGCGT